MRKSSKIAGVPEAISKGKRGPLGLSPLSLQEQMPMLRCLGGTSVQCKLQPTLIQLPPGPYRQLSLGLPALSRDSAGNTH